MIYRKSILAGLTLFLTALLLIVEYDFLIPQGQGDELSLEWELEEKFETGGEETFENDFSHGGADDFAPSGERQHSYLLIEQQARVKAINKRPKKLGKNSLSILYCSLKLDFC